MCLDVVRKRVCLGRKFQLWERENTTPWNPTVKRSKEFKGKTVTRTGRCQESSSEESDVVVMEILKHLR